MMTPLFVTVREFWPCIDHTIIYFDKPVRCLDRCCCFICDFWCGCSLFVRRPASIRLLLIIILSAWNRQYSAISEAEEFHRWRKGLMPLDLSLLTFICLVFNSFVSQQGHWWPFRSFSLCAVWLHSFMQHAAPQPQTDHHHTMTDS